MSIEIKVLGPGCARCKQLYSEAERAIAQLAAPATLIKVEDPHDTNGVATITTGFTLADGRSLGITYEPNGAAITGRLKTITLPERNTEILTNFRVRELRRKFPH